jgi:hypothetical protein
MPLDTDQISWLVRISGVAIETGGEDDAPKQPGSGKEQDPAEALKPLLEPQLLAKHEEEEFADEQRKALLVSDALRRIEPLKTKLRASNDIMMRNQDEQLEFLAANTTLVGEVREIKQDTVVSRDDLEVEFDPKADGELLEKMKEQGPELQKRAEELKKAGKQLDKKEQEALQKYEAAAKKRADYRQILNTIQKDAHQSMQLIATIRKDLEGRSTSRSLLDWDGALRGYESSGKAVALFKPGPERPLFTTRELMDELFTPLVNEHVLAEGFIIDKFSATQQMLDATNAVYMKELENATDPTTGLAEFAQSMIDLGHDLASGIMNAVGVDTSLAKGVLEGCTALMKLSVTAADKLPDGLDSATTEELVSGTLGVLGGMLTSMLPDGAGTEAGKAITNWSGPAVKGVGLLVTSIRNGEKPKPESLVLLFSGAMTAGLQSIPDGDDSRTANLISLFDSVQQSIASSINAKLADFTKAVQNGDPRAIRAALTGMCMEMVASIPAMAGDVYDASQPDGDFSDVAKESGELAAQLIEAQKAYKEQLAEIEKEFVDSPNDDEDTKKKKAQDKAAKQKQALMSKMDKSAQAHFDMLEKQLAPKAKERAEDDQSDYEGMAEGIEQQLESEREAFNAALKDAEDPTKAEKTIAGLMQKMARDKAILSVAVAIGQAGFSLAAQFVAPLAMGVEAIKLAQNVAAAVQRAVDLRKFVDEEIGAKAGTSPYLTSIQNFVENQQNQLTHYSLQAALNGAKLIAAAVATAFPMASPAVTAVGMAQAASQALYDFYNKQQVVKAWDVTKKALSDPKNRRLGLQARRVNPTLAKYAIAYGAMEEKDPVAVHMANACGLDNDTLADRNSNVDRVQKYLEARFDDDQRVTGAIQRSDEWSAKLPEAELKSPTLFRAYQIIEQGFRTRPIYSETFGDATLEPPGELIGFIRTLEKRPLAEDAGADVLDERLLLLGNIGKSLRAEGQRLLKLDGTAQDVLMEYADLAAGEQEALAMALVKKKVEAAKGKPKQGNSGT